MQRELEVLNDYVDGYLMAVYEEQEGNLKAGKTTFLEAFRHSLAAIPSNKEGEELVKLINRGLLKAKQADSKVSINMTKGFNESLETLQNKIKELFQLEDLTTGTIAHFLADVPKVVIPAKPKSLEGTGIFGNISPSIDDETDSEIDLIHQAVADIKIAAKKQNDVLKEHLSNNGKVVIMSDLGYSDCDQIDDNLLETLIEGNEKSMQELDKMVEAAISMIKKVKKMYRENKNKKKKDDDDPLGLLNNDDEDDE
jgi:hypothetical protein